MKENEIITPLGCGRETNRLTTLSSPKNPPPCRQHVPHVHLGCFFRYLVSVCLRACACKASVRLCACARACARSPCAKTEAAPGCTAYTQTVPSSNYLRAPSTVHGPERASPLMAVFARNEETRRGRGVKNN